MQNRRYEFMSFAFAFHYWLVSHQTIFLVYCSYIKIRTILIHLALPFVENIHLTNIFIFGWWGTNQHGIITAKRFAKPPIWVRVLCICIDSAQQRKCPRSIASIRVDSFLSFKTRTRNGERVVVEVC